MRGPHHHRGVASTGLVRQGHLRLGLGKRSLELAPRLRPDAGLTGQCGFSFGPCLMVTILQPINVVNIATLMAQKIRTKITFTQTPEVPEVAIIHDIAMARENLNRTSFVAPDKILDPLQAIPRHHTTMGNAQFAKLIVDRDLHAKDFESADLFA
jgi:hypothetical protein